MAKVLCVGLATLDFIYRLDTLPSLPQKYPAQDALIVGGGGAANAAVAVARLGGTAVLGTRVGDDTVGDMILADLAAEGVDVTDVTRSPGARSSWSSVCIDAAGERQIVNFRGVGPAMETGWFDGLAGIGAVLADTRQAAAAIAAMQFARARGLPGVVDAEAPIDPGILAHASHVAFSMQGLRSLAPAAGPQAALAEIAAKYGIWAAVTDGERGVWFTGPDGIAHLPAFPVRAVDTLGAGDVWHGAFALALAEGAADIDAIRFANAAAALKCTSPGGRAGCPDRDTVARFLETAVL